MRLFFLGLLSVYSNWMISQNIEFAGNIETNTYWDYDTVWLTGNVVIFENSVLGIAPGTNIVSKGYYRFDAFGSIVALGNLTDSIVFTVEDPTNFSDTSLYEEGGWDGIHFFPSNLNDSSEFSYCRFSYGKAVSPNNQKGGMFLISNRNNVSFSNCSFINNLCLESGGALYSNSSNNIFNSLFLLNRSYSYGGGVNFCASNIEPIVSGCSFIKNIAFRYEIDGVNAWVFGHGSGIYISTSNSPLYMPKIVNNLFWANMQNPIYESCYNILIANNLIINNLEGYLNGISIGNQKIINNTFSGNYGESVYCANPQLKFYNNIITNCIGSWSTYSGDATNSFVGIADVEYCNIQAGNYCQNLGVISEDSDFINPIPTPDYNVWGNYLHQLETSEMPIFSFEMQDFDFSLKDESPCVNSGIPNIVGLLLPETDYNGQPRVFGNRIDMGAIENQHVISYIPSALAAKYSVFPNPCTNQIFIAGVKTDIPVEIFNVTGSSVLFTEYTSQGIDLSTLEPGFYTLRFTSNKKTQSIKFVKN